MSQTEEIKFDQSATIAAVQMLRKLNKRLIELEQMINSSKTPQGDKWLFDYRLIEKEIIVENIEKVEKMIETQNFNI